MSAEQYGNQMEVEAAAAKRLVDANRQRRAYSEKNIQALPAGNQAEARKIAAMMSPVAPTTTISDDMRSVASALSVPVENPVARFGTPSSSPPPRQPYASQRPKIDSKPLTVNMFGGGFGGGGGGGTRLVDPYPAKGESRKPKSTPTPAKQPAVRRGPIVL
jgi:hypothetical protein